MPRKTVIWIAVVLVVAVTSLSVLAFLQPDLSRTEVEARLRLQMTPREIETALGLRPGTVKLEPYELKEQAAFQANLVEPGLWSLVVPKESISLFFDERQRLIWGWWELVLSADELDEEALRLKPGP